MTRAGLLLALMLSGCAATEAAPISYGRSGAGPAEPSAPTRQQRRQPAPIEQVTPIQAPPRQAAPQPNWAAGAGTPLSTYALRPEDAQPYDPAHLPRSHRVGENQSLYDIATLYQVPLRALIDQNHLEPPYALTPGAVIQLPPPRTHRVERNESFEDIARRYNVDLRSLALLNRMQPPYEVRAGQDIVLPAMARENNLGPPASSPAISANVANTIAGGAPAVQVGTGQFAWPLRGQIVARFGVQPGGGRLDGIEIAGRTGDPVNAAADGDIVYAGSDLAAYGTLVLVRHADNFVTAYGYAQRALVREGQHVRAGQAIAELGPRPDGQARLLFQMRRGTEAIDPLPLMGASPR